MASKFPVLCSVGDPSSMASIAGRKVILAGEPVFAALSTSEPPLFVAQQPRDAAAGLLAQFRKNSPKVFVAVDERLLALTRMRFALAFDGYLAWGLRERSKAPVVLFGGGESESSVNLEILVFAENRLIELREKSLPGTGSTYFRNVVQGMLEELRMNFPTARFVQAAPLADWALEGVEYIGEKPLRGLSFRPLTRMRSRHSNFVVPAALTMLGLLAYPGAAVTGWNAYSSAVADYERAIADPAIKAKGGMDTDFLATMNARRIYMEQPRRQTALANKASSIVRSIASVPGVRIVEMKLPAPGISVQNQIGITVNPDAEKARNKITADRPPDVWVSIAVPRSGEAAIVQAKVVLTVIANTTGMSLRLAHAGWRDEQSRRIFNIEGFVHD